MLQIAWPCPSLVSGGHGPSKGRRICEADHFCYPLHLEQAEIERLLGWAIFCNVGMRNLLDMNIGRQEGRNALEYSSLRC